MIVIPNEEILLSNNSIVGSNNYVIVLSEFSADVIQVDFCKFRSNIVGIFIFESSAKGGIEVGFEVIHGEESFEQGEPTDWKLAVINEIDRLAETHNKEK